jgi:AbiU2
VWWDIIAQDIYTAYLWRSTWLTVGDIVRENPDVRPSHYFAYLSSTYGSSEAVAVRRLADERKDVVSLVTLIKDIRRHARVITADWWVGLQAGADIRDFRRFEASGTNHFDPAIAARDLAQLHAAVARVKKYVDHHLAHRDQDPTKEIPTFADIHAALDSVGEVFRTYCMLLTGADMPSLVPEPDIGWYLPLTVPWLPPGSEPPRLRGTFRGKPL